MFSLLSLKSFFGHICFSARVMKGDHAPMRTIDYKLYQAVMSNFFSEYTTILLNICLEGYLTFEDENYIFGKDSSYQLIIYSTIFCQPVMPLRVFDY